MNAALKKKASAMKPMNGVNFCDVTHYGQFMQKQQELRTMPL